MALINPTPLPNPSRFEFFTECPECKRSVDSLKMRKVKDHGEICDDCRYYYNKADRPAYLSRNAYNTMVDNSQASGEVRLRTPWEDSLALVIPNPAERMQMIQDLERRVIERAANPIHFITGSDTQA